MTAELRERPHVIKVKAEVQEVAEQQGEKKMYEHRVKLPWGATLRFVTLHRSKDLYFWSRVGVYMWRRVNWLLLGALTTIFVGSIYVSLWMDDAQRVDDAVQRCAHNMDWCSFDQVTLCRPEIVRVHSLSFNEGEWNNDESAAPLLRDLAACFQENHLVSLTLSGARLAQLVALSAIVWFLCFMFVHAVVNYSVSYTKSGKKSSAPPVRMEPV